MKQYEQEYRRFLNSGVLNAEELSELAAIENNEDEKALRFSAPMDFGTAGLRSTMCVGIGSMNRLTVAQTTKGLAALVKKSGGESRGVVIAYDSRNNSRAFARVSAEVLAAAGIRVYIFDDLRPTPELSFALRHLGAIAGINITASHNPKEYNGYKAYWEDGAQLAPEQAAVVKAETAKFDVLDIGGRMDYDEALAKGLITELAADFDEIYLSAVMATAVSPAAVAEVSDSLRVVYTPLHGAGCRLVPEIFSRMGLKNLYTVAEQMAPNGDFPTVKKPNPEHAEAFSLGIALADRVGSDLVIATDPDADRVGVMARNKNGKFETISGNQMGALLLDYIIRKKKALGTLPEKPYCVKSIVSTDMASRIADVHGIRLHDVLTGFKFIGEVIKNYEAENNAEGFLLGFEESYGYLGGAYARDKDAVEASMLILEMTADYKKRGMTLIDALHALYEAYGYYAEGVVDIYMEGLDGIEKRRRLMENLRKMPPKSFAGYAVASIGDYAEGYFTNLSSGKKTATNLPSSDVLYYVLENEDKIIVRPSGTEPKVKMYFLAHGEESAALAAKLASYKEDALSLVHQS